MSPFSLHGQNKDGAQKDGQQRQDVPSSLDFSAQKLLRMLSPEEQQRLFSRMHHVALEPRQILWKFDSIVEHCYFPLHGVISLTAVMSDGHMSEVGLVGSEGFVGTSVVLGEERAGNEVLVQVPPCDALAIKSADLRKLCQELPALNALLLRYTNAQLVCAAQASACNALHPAEERLARWLLMVQDRIKSDLMPITHEFLAIMIGTRRATVTVVAGALERAGILQLNRGEIRVLNRSKLEDSACECYGIMRQAVERVVSPSRVAQR